MGQFYLEHELVSIFIDKNVWLKLFPLVRVLMLKNYEANLQRSTLTLRVMIINFPMFNEISNVDNVTCVIYHTSAGGDYALLLWQCIVVICIRMTHISEIF